MRDLLARAFDEAAKLPDDDQDAFARWLLAELASEQRWRESLARSHDALDDLADEALAQLRSGQAGPLRF